MSSNLRMAYIFLLLFAAGGLQPLFASAIVVGTNTSTLNAPFGQIGTSGVRFQASFTAAGDLATLSGGAIITELNFYYAGFSGSAVTLSDFTVRIGYSAFGATLSAGQNFDANLSATRPYWYTCKSSPSYSLNPTGTNGVDERARGILDRAFAFNGAEDLLIDISFTGRTAGAAFNVNTGTGRQVVYVAGAGVGPSTAAPTTANSFGNIMMEIVFDERPNLDVYMHVGTQLVVDANETGAGGNGLQVAKFHIESNMSNQLPADLLTITVQDRSNPGNVTTAYTDAQTGTLPFGVKLYRDDQVAPAPGAGVFSAGDVELNTQEFTVDDGDITFTISGPEQTFAPLQIKTYFIVVKLMGAEPGALTPVPLDQYQMRVKGVTSGVGGGFNPTGIGTVPEACFPYAAGILIDPPEFAYSEVPLGMRTAYLSSSNNVLMAFEVAYPGGPQNYQNSITISASGTGLDQVDFNQLDLVWDVDLTNTVTPSDVVVFQYPGGHFPNNDGDAAFTLPTLPGAAGEFIAPVTRRFLIVVGFGGLGVRGSTYFAQVTASGGQQGGAVVTGQPCPAMTTTGLTVEGNDLVATRNGPNLTRTINSTSQGTLGNGELLLDITVVSLNGDWTASDFIFTAGGTGNPTAAFSDVQLYEEFNGDAQFSGPSIDPVATVAPSSFVGGVGGDYTATLLAPNFFSGVPRRFYLMVKLSGSALTGETFSCNITDIAWSSKPFGGTSSQVVIGAGAGFGLVIDVPLITVSLAPTSPGSRIIEHGTTEGHTLAVFRYSADNANITVTATTFTTTGTGDFELDLSPVNALEAYLDNGNGVYDISDQFLGETSGDSPTVTLGFGAGFVVQNGQFADIIIRINVLATCGGSVPETFRVSVNSPGDVLATGAPAVVLGLPAPASNTLGVIIYFVGAFIPLVGSQAGGEAIVINGSGFTAPAACSIGGVLCTGSAVVNAQGTQITGLQVPPGSGKDLTIILTTSALGARTLPLTFSYAGSSKLPAGGSSSSCRAGESASGPVLTATLLAAILGSRLIRLRRRRE